VNTCLQHLRKEKVRQRTNQEQAEQTTTVVEPSHDDPHQNLYRAIGQLNEIDRLIITMVLEELEYEEIAKVVGIEENNLRVRIHRIKKKLKETLEHEQRI
jgi:RNA polymerase sigma factor (sigma-70 family)